MAFLIMLGYLIFKINLIFVVWVFVVMFIDAYTVKLKSTDK